MPNEPFSEGLPAHDHAARPFFVVEFPNGARTAALDEALSWLRRTSEATPGKTFVICRIVATAEPSIGNVITHHRL